MIDEEHRLVHCDHLPDFFHRSDRFCLVGIERWNYVSLQILFRMNDVPGQDDEAGILEMDEQRLVAGVCPGVETKVTLPSPNTSVSPSMS